MERTSPPTGEEVVGWLESLSNWGRWGPHDRIGTLNYVTPEKILRAARLIRSGLTVTCSRIIEPENAPDNVVPPLHFMFRTGESAPARGKGGAGDFIGTAIHGYNITHIDAHSHQLWNSKSYNGIEARRITSRDRASDGGIQVLENGVVTRGVLLDIARLRGVDWMGPGEAIFPNDLEQAETAEGVKVEPGDAVLYRTGWARARDVHGPPAVPNRPGLHAACLPWLHERRVALIAADAATDVEPTGYEDVLPDGGEGKKGWLPVHTVGITSMGLWILDCGHFERLAQVCSELGRWEFLFIMAPLRWRNATGSPVNPIAVF